MIKRKIKWTEVIEVFAKAGFDKKDEFPRVNSQSDLDEEISVGEYPCGESVKKALDLLGFEIEVDL